MSEFSKGDVLEAEQLYRGKRKYFRFDFRSAAIFKPSSGNNFRNCLIEVGDTEPRPFCFPFSATFYRFRSRSRKDREKAREEKS